jgi:hypothetical protein
MKKYLLALILLLSLSCVPSVHACDDALVMLLTAQNPKSEFSVSIRAFITSLTVLGTSLKNETNPPFTNELKAVMEAWLDFSQRYMAYPPEEAKNDRTWVEKMSNVAKLIGRMRKDVAGQRYMAAHDGVLEISTYIGRFFEGFGVSAEKQLFIRASTLLVELQRGILSHSYEGALELRAQIDGVLQEFKGMLPRVPAAQEDFEAAVAQHHRVYQMIGEKADFVSIDLEISNLQVYVDQLRSLILMEEWFPGILDSEKE